MTKNVKRRERRGGVENEKEKTGDVKRCDKGVGGLRRRERETDWIGLEDEPGSDDQRPGCGEKQS